MNQRNFCDTGFHRVQKGIASHAKWFYQGRGRHADVKVADCRYNADRIIEAMERMARKQVALLVTPQLGITAHTCGDLFFQQALIAAAMDELLRIRDASAGSDMITVAGLPVCVGNVLYNAAAVVQNRTDTGRRSQTDAAGTRRA